MAVLRTVLFHNSQKHAKSQKLTLPTDAEESELLEKTKPPGSGSGGQE